MLNPKIWRFWSFSGHFGAKNNADRWDFSQSILNQSGPLGGRWKAYSVAHLMTPQWSGMVESTSRYRPGKLTLLNPKHGHFRSFWGQKSCLHLGLFSKHSQPIRATRGSLESLLGRLQNDTTMVGNGSDYFEIQAWEVDFAQPKIWAF